MGRRGRIRLVSAERAAVRLPPAAWAAVLLLGLVPLVLAVTVDYRGYGRGVPAPVTTLTVQGDFVKLAELSACQGTLPVGGRDYETLANLPDANCTIWEVPCGVNYLQLRFQIDADANTATVEGWWSGRRYNPGDYHDRFTRGWSWSITGGQQPGPASNVFVDIIDVNETWPSAGIVTDPNTNRICTYDVDLRGIGYLAFVRSDSDANLAVVIDGRWY
jgi:hypothetical protein